VGLILPPDDESRANYHKIVYPEPKDEAIESQFIEVPSS
jgi:hypothetical protein